MVFSLSFYFYLFFLNTKGTYNFINNSNTMLTFVIESLLNYILVMNCNTILIAECSGIWGLVILLQAIWQSIIVALTLHNYLKCRQWIKIKCKVHNSHHSYTCKNTLVASQIIIQHWFSNILFTSDICIIKKLNANEEVWEKGI